MNTPESMDYPGRGTELRHRDPYDPQFASGRFEPAHESAATGGATDLLDFPPFPGFPRATDEAVGSYSNADGWADREFRPQPFPDPLADDYGGAYFAADTDTYTGTDAGSHTGTETDDNRYNYAGADSDTDTGTDTYGTEHYTYAEPDAAVPQLPTLGTPADPASDAAQPAGLQVASVDQATARLLIKLPPSPPQPSTTLRPHAAWEDRSDAELPQGVPGPRRGSAPAAPFAQVAASPARPSALPSELAALTTATLVVPLPHASRPTPALLTTTLPPDMAAQANAAALAGAFNDTLEHVFGLDLDDDERARSGPVDLDPQDLDTAGIDEAAAIAERDLPAHWFRDQPANSPAPLCADDTVAIGLPDQSSYQYLPGAVPSSGFGGRYGVPTQPAVFTGAAGHPEGHDPARHALALRYLGGIFHNSSGESAYLDPGSPPTRALRGPVATPTAGPLAPSEAPTQQLRRIPAQAGTGTGTSHYGAPQSTASAQRAAPQHAAAAPTAVPHHAAPRPTPAAAPHHAAPQPTTYPLHAARQPTAALGRTSTQQAAVPAADTQAGPAHAAPSRSNLPPSSPGPAGPSTPPGRVGQPERTAPALKAAQAATAHRAQGDVDETDGEERDSAPDTSRRPGGAALTVVAVLAAAFALLYGVALAVASGVFGGAVPRGTVVAGVPIGALSPADAEQVLDERLGPAAQAPIPLVIGQTPASLDPAASGLSLDAAGTVQAATRDRTNPLVIIPALFGATHQVAPVPKVNKAALKRALDAFAAAYDTPMVEGGITFKDAVPVVTEPRQGRGFSVAGALTAIGNGYLRVDGPIPIPVQALSPKATPAALQDALAGLARPAVAAPITLVTGDATTQLTPAQIGAALSIAPDASGRMTPRLDGTRLRGYLGANALAQEQPAVNAAFSLGQDRRPLLIPARDGRGFGAATLADAVLAALTAPAPRTAQVPLGPLPAAFTTADAQALGVTDVLASDVLPVPAAPSRSADVLRTAALVTGSVVQPGETWSFLKTVAAPTVANGFAVGSAAQHAGTDPTGGVDTVATGVFDAAFAAGMGDTEHHPHASYIDRYPVGLDAAVVAPGTDLRWTNTGDHPVYLYVSYAERSLTVALLGEKAYDQVSVQVSQRTAIVQSSPARGSCAQSPVPGFQVNVTRMLLRGGSQVGTEQFRVTYEPQGGLGCYGGSPSGAASGAAPSSGSGSTTSGGSDGGSGSGNGSGSTGASAPSSAPSPSATGILGGLIH